MMKSSMMINPLMVSMMATRQPLLMASCLPMRNFGYAARYVGPNDMIR